MIAETPQEFAEAAVRLYSEPEFWKIQQDHSLSLIQKLYCPSEELLRRVEEIRENLSTHREQNVIGKMLALHAFRSTKYFSRWIEEKSKRLSRDESHEGSRS